MKFLSLRFNYFFIACLFAALQSSAQTNGEDSFLLKARIDNAVSIYHAFLFPETALYNGAEYVIYQHKLDEGDPFFQSRYFDSSSVFYDGIFYANIRMSYDIMQGVVIVDYPVNASRIQLENDLVDRFTLGTHHFMRIDKDSSGNLFPGTGFYEVLYSGTNLLLKKQTKEVNEVNLVEGVRRTINERIAYYLKKNGVYYSVNNKGSLLDALRDKKKMIRQFIHQNKLDTKRDMENSFIKILNYYEGKD
jgi:hypothetical protein